MLKLTNFEVAYEPYLFSYHALWYVLVANQRLKAVSARGAGAGNAAMGLLELLVLLRVAGPELRLDVALMAEAEDARSVLLREPPYGAVHVSVLQVAPHPTHVLAFHLLGRMSGDHMRSLAAALAASASLYRLEVSRSDLGVPAGPLPGDAAPPPPPAVDALVDAVLARGLKWLDLYECTFTAGALPQLARLLVHDGTALTHLSVWRCPSLFAHAQEAEVAEFCAALQRNESLRWLELCRVDLSPAAEAALRAAVAARPPTARPLRMLT